jgi:hypothetical protein
MTTTIPPNAFRVVVIRPKNEILGGDPATNDDAALKYAEFPSAIKVTKRAPKDFRSLKVRAIKFFKRNNQHPAQYTVETRWAFSTYKEAQDKLLYEANMCGHFIEWGQGTWIQMHAP